MGKLLYNRSNYGKVVVFLKCIKCGRETISEQVFCPDCQVEMQRYPVRPGTVVQLPPRQETSNVKKVSRKKTISLEEQVESLKKQVRTLWLSLILVSILAASLSVPTYQHWKEGQKKIGQNYTAVVATSEPTTGN